MKSVSLLFIVLPVLTYFSAWAPWADQWTPLLIALGSLGFFTVIGAPFAIGLVLWQAAFAHGLVVLFVIGLLIPAYAIARADFPMGHTGRALGLAGLELVIYGFAWFSNSIWLGVIVVVPWLLANSALAIIASDVKELGLRIAHLGVPADSNRFGLSKAGYDEILLHLQGGSLYDSGDPERLELIKGMFLRIFSHGESWDDIERSFQRALGRDAVTCERGAGSLSCFVKRFVEDTAVSGYRLKFSRVAQELTVDISWETSQR